MKLLTETWLLFLRGLRSSFRNPGMIIMGLFQPLCYVLLFAPLLDGLAKTPGFPSGSGLTVFTPGVLILMGILSAAFVGFGLIADLRSGVIERMRVTPASRLALLLGSVMRDVVFLLIQAILLVALAIPLGLKTTFAGILLALGLLTLVGVMMASLSYALAIAIKNENALAGMINFFALPLLLLSGIMLPLTLAPDWMRFLATLNPFSHAVDAMRALVNGSTGENVVWQGFLIIGVLAVLATLWAWRSFRQATA